MHDEGRGGWVGQRWGEEGIPYGIRRVLGGVLAEVDVEGRAGLV